MKIVAIDASRHFGAVSRSVEAAALAAESVGATVSRVNLRDLEIRTCTHCCMCHASGVCKIQDGLPNLAQLINEANGIIFGTPDSSRQASDATNAILDRLSGYFNSDQMCLPGIGSSTAPQTRSAKLAKRAIIITACRSSQLLATFFGYTNGPIRQLRSTLAASGIRTIGTLEVRGATPKGEYSPPDIEIASSLGRLVAGKI